MAENRLTNAGFEADWAEEQSHRALYVTADGKVVEHSVGNVFTPPGYLTWFRHEPGKWDQPEVRDAWKSGDPLRVRSGEKAILLFTFYRRHDGGFMQTAPVTKGKRYRLEAWAHAWSNHNLPGGHLDDPRWSDGAPLVGYNRCVSLLPQHIPMLNGDPQNDAVGNFLFILGIDPLGGTNPMADSIVWGTPVANYNGHSPVPAVEAVAQADKMTVYLRSTTLWAFKHNDAYWDDASLVEVDGQPPGRQYQRYYVLLPPDASKEEVGTAVERFYEARRTIGFSADDAGIHAPELTRRTVHALHASRWPGKSQGLRDFYRDFYPGIDELIIEEDAQDPLAKWQPFALSQRDPRWANVKRSGTYCTTTIGTDGCWEDVCAMAQNILGLRTNATPVTVNQELGPSGFTSDCQVTWAAMKAKLGIEVVSSVRTLPADYPGTGKLAFADTAAGTGKHFWLVCERLGDGFIAIDPWDGKVKMLNPASVDDYRLVRTVQAAPGEPQHPYRGNPISLHSQAGGQGDKEFIERVQPAAVKLVLAIERAQWVKSLSPNTKVVYRHYIGDNYDPYWRHAQGPLAGARAYLRTFLDSLRVNAANVDYVESINEMIATGDTDGIKRTVDFDVAFCEALKEEGYPARPVLLTAAVGNPQHGAETELLIPAAKAAYEAKGALGYHSYWGARPGYCTMDDAWQHYAGRALENWDPVFRKQGIYPDYIFGEGGAVGISIGGAMNAAAGWKHKDCLAGDWLKYQAQIVEFKRRVDAWNAAHGNRCLGVMLFTVGGYGWVYFELAGKLVDLAAALAP